MLSDCQNLNRLTGYRGRREKMMVKDLRQRSGLAWFCAIAESCVVFNTGPYTVLPDNSINTANMQSETSFPSSHQLKSYVASKSLLKLAARAVLSADAGLLVNSMAGLIYCGNDNISCQSVMHMRLCMWLTKFQVHVHIQVHASGLPRVRGYSSGTGVINYPGNFLLPDGYQGSEYLICRIHLIGFSELVQ